MGSPHKLPLAAFCLLSSYHPVPNSQNSVLPIIPYLTRYNNFNFQRLKFD